MGERGLDSEGSPRLTRANPRIASDAVAKTLASALELLTEDERARFAELAIFPEDIDVPLHRRALWSRTAGLDEFDTEDLCTRLYGLLCCWASISRPAASACTT